jgi:hypothetical protein
MANQEGELEKIESRLKSIEARLTRLESSLNRSEDANSYRYDEIKGTAPSQVISETVNEEEKGLESQIGRFVLSWMGNIVLLLGITFLTEYIMGLGHQLLSVLLGYGAAASILFIANYLKRSNVHLAFIFNLNGQLLLFFITLRMHFFSTAPLISDKTISIVLLMLLVSFQVYLAIRNKSQSYATLSVIFAIATAIMSDMTHVMLPLVILTATTILFYFYRYDWQPLTILTILFTYICFFMWLFGNPIMGHTMQLLQEHQSGVIYLFGLGGIFSILPLFRKDEGSSDDFLIGSVIVNGLLFTLLVILVAVRFYSSDYVGLFAIITLSCLIYSTVLKSTSNWHFASAYYALYGFMAMSISLYGLFGFPGVYLLLSLQSLVVVTMALWFRNRLIVVMNSLLFITILIVYLISSKHGNAINFSFALVALVSARIINWQKSRLEIKTDLIRNLYLIEGFIVVLYALYHAVPRQFVTLSWTMAALLYFLLSFLLKNVKYRYMALGTMISAAFYLFIVDLARIGVIYRVLAFLFLAIISIGISIYYTNRIKKPHN